MTFQVLHSGKPRLYSLILNKAGKTFQVQTLQLRGKFINYDSKKFYNIGPRLASVSPGLQIVTAGKSTYVF
jgi:hypothetical protein